MGVHPDATRARPKEMRRSPVSTPQANAPVAMTDPDRGRLGPAMDVITTTEALAAVCARMAKHAYVTVDTEFLRETTYYPLLCVAQMASPEEAVVVDALATGIDLSPLFALMASEKVTKVFHAAR